MANYKEILSTLEKGSLNKTPIYFEKQMGTFSGGRRLAKNDVAGGAYDVFDLGEDERTISLNLYVCGDDFYAQAERLVKLLNSGEALDLAHPFFRKKTRVLCKTWTYETVSETYQSINATFTVLAPSGAAMTEKLNTFLDKVNGTIEEGKYYLNQGMAHVAVAAKTVDQTKAMFDTVMGSMSVLMNDAKNNANFLKRFNEMLEGIDGAAANAVGFVISVVEAFKMEADALRDKASVNNLLDSTLFLANYDHKGDEFMKITKDALVFALLSNYATVAQNYAYESTEEQKAQIYKLDLLLNASKDSLVYESLLDLKNECVKYLYDNAATKIYAKKVSDNVLNAVFMEYGGIENLDEILNENMIDDPFFVDEELKFYDYK